jgi:CHAD domain-containing protein
MDDRSSLLVLLSQRLTTLIDAMPAAQAGDMRSVHQARVATRRLREALPVVGASVSARSLGRVRRQVRRMTRALGPVRELDVALAHLDELAASNVISPRALARVRQLVAQERLARRRDMLQAITPGRIEKLRRRLGEVGTTEDPPLKAAAIEAAEYQVGRRAQTIATAIEHAGGLYLPDRLHAVRVAAKKLRYALEIERELKKLRGTARIAQLKLLQDLLGRMHDFEMLIDRTRQLQADVAGSDRRLAFELDRLIRTLEQECRQLHAVYMRRRASILKLASQVSSATASRPSAVA